MHTVVLLAQSSIEWVAGRLTEVVHMGRRFLFFAIHSFALSLTTSGLAIRLIGSNVLMHAFA